MLPHQLPEFSWPRGASQHHMVAARGPALQSTGCPYHLSSRAPSTPGLPTQSEGMCSRGRARLQASPQPGRSLPKGAARDNSHLQEGAGVSLPEAQPRPCPVPGLPEPKRPPALIGGCAILLTPGRRHPRAGLVFQGLEQELGCEGAGVGAVRQAGCRSAGSRGPHATLPSPRPPGAPQGSPRCRRQPAPRTPGQSSSRGWAVACRGHRPHGGCPGLPSARCGSLQPCVDGVSGLVVGGRGTPPPPAAPGAHVLSSAAAGGPFQDPAQEASVQKDVLALVGGRGGWLRGCDPADGFQTSGPNHPGGRHKGEPLGVLLWGPV